MWVWVGHAQDYIVSLQHLTVEDGLIHREVKSIYQDSRDFIWLSTPQGISRYDGYEFKNWYKENGLNLMDTRIVTEDAEGYLWLISDVKHDEDRIVLLHIETGEVVSFKEKFGEQIASDLPSKHNKFLKGRDGTIYFVDDKRTSLFSYHPSKGFQKVELEIEGGIELLFFTSTNTIWAHQAKKGISFYQQNNSNARSDHYKDMVVEINLKGETLYQFKHNAYLGTSRFFINEDELWYQEEPSSGVGDFYKIDKERHQSKMTLEQLNLEELRSQGNNFKLLDYLSIGQATFGIVGHQLLLMDPERGAEMNLNDQYPVLENDKGIGYRGYFKDNKGKVWLGGDFGCYILDIQKSPFTKKMNLSLNADQNMGLACRKISKINNEIFVATEGSAIVHLDSGDQLIENSFNRSIQTIDNQCWSLAQLSSGRILTGCYPYVSVVNMTSRTARLVKVENDKNLGIWSFYEDRKGVVWMGENGGLRILSKGEEEIQAFRKYNEFPELRNATILDIKEDRDGTIWLSTYRGFYILDITEGIVARYWSGGKDEYYIPTDNVQHFHHDDDHIYWLATGGDGLIRWDKKEGTTKQFSILDGLSSNVLYGVYEDDYNNLWMSSDYGIIQFDKITMSSQSFLLNDGITHNEFNRVSHFQDNDGTIYFGGLNGVTVFHPRDISLRDTIKDVSIRITEFLQFDGDQNQLVDRTGALIKTGIIKMLPSDRFFQLSFALLAYEDASQIRYAYKIEGQDMEWVEQKSNSIRISRLPYGSYNLKIKGQSPNGEWSRNELEFKLKIIRPFYLRTWFFVLSALLLSLLAYWLYKFNLNRKMVAAESRRLIDLDTQKTKLFTYISHEFRTPLTVIMGMADNIRNQPQEKRLIKRNGKNLLHLVNQLLDLSKVNAGKVKLNLKQADMITHLRFLIESFYSLALEKKLKLSFKPEEDELIMDFDELKIQQVIYNLVSNAIKFTPQNGAVDITSKKLFKLEEAFLQVSVKDTGRGISKESSNRIFDRFYQVDSSNLEKRRGTGVGLSLTKELIELMDGTIAFESEIDRGSTFTIILPIKNEARLETLDSLDSVLEVGETSIKQDVLPKDFLDSEPPIVLIVEDNIDVATYIQSCIPTNYKVHIAINGKEGVEKAFEIIPTIVISDVMMPEKDGYELTAILKRDTRTSHIPIILLTAKAAIDDKIHGLEVGADAYLLKPFYKEELLVRIRKLIESRKLLHSYYASLSSVNPKRDEPMTMDDIFVHKIHELVTKEMSNSELNAEHLCSEMGLSQAQLYRKMNALIGRTPVMYIRSIRLKKAMELLTESRLNVSEVAYQVGFSDPKYFSRIFIEAHDITPSTIIEKRVTRTKNE